MGSERYRLAINAVTSADTSMLSQTETLPHRSMCSAVVAWFRRLQSNRDRREIHESKRSGRCWLFAHLNVARIAMMEKYGLESDFELSQNWLHFWDKIERANYFLECILSTLSDDLDSRLVQHLLSTPMNDGGQWDMSVSLIKKYGLVPKSAFPEAHTSGASVRMNRLLNNKLRQFAYELRKAHAENGASVAQLRENAKPEMMKLIHRIVIIHLGQPPSTFDWSFYGKIKKEDGDAGDDEKKRGKKKQYHCFRSLTPLQFYKEHVPVDFTEFVSIINDPRNEYYKLYTVKMLGNVVGTDSPVRYINLPIDELRSIAKSVIDGGEPVWFGCDVGKHFHREMGVMSLNLLNYELSLGTHPHVMDKATRLRYGESLMTHAMCFTGYDASSEGSGVAKWRVENSWGDKNGDKGFLLMSDDWFAEYTYQIAVKRGVLSENILSVLASKAIELPAWDPMGALA